MILFFLGIGGVMVGVSGFIFMGVLIWAMLGALFHW